MIIIRSASDADIGSMARLRLSSDWSGGADEERMRRYLAGEHHPQHARTPRVAFVAESAAEIIGFIAGHLTTRFGCEGELQWLLVAPAYRGGPTGSELLSGLAEWFAQQAARRVCVNVASDDARARRFYTRHGAVELSEYWMVWPDIATAEQRNDAWVNRAELQIPAGERGNMH